MVIYENIEINGRAFIKAYSDNGVMIHGGSPEANYNESIDPAEFNRQYTETDIPIEPGEAEAEEIVDILMGVSE